jgi:NAD(P)H-hydrate epimerase
MSALHHVPVVTAEEARELDVRTIATLTDSYTLMHRAADAAACWLHARNERSAAVFCGPGNNGGDGWLVAGLLRARGWVVRVYAAGDPRTDDAQRAKAEAEQGTPFELPTGTESLVIDALLGTGATGALRGEIVAAVAAMRASSGTLIAIDIPSGLDATTGEDHGAVPAAHTITFGSIKCAHLLRRDVTGALHVLDIGLLTSRAGVPHLVVDAAMQQWIPPQAADAWKGTRGRVAVVGGDTGMAGAVILAARGSHASGAGMLRLQVAQASMTAVQVAAPYATAVAWASYDFANADLQWPDAMVIGPGLDGTADVVRDGVLRLLHAYRGPVVLDAGALTAFAWCAPRAVDDGDDTDRGVDDALQALRAALAGRPALLTPHIGEFTRLFAPGAAPQGRFTAPAALAAMLGATVLLKGVPTVIAAPDGTTLVSAAGNPALAMGGSGDLLSGIAGALLAQGLSPLHAGAAAALAHGRAAEHAAERVGGWRGVTMDLLLHALEHSWHRDDAVSQFLSGAPTVLVTLPAVPSR